MGKIPCKHHPHQKSCHGYINVRQNSLKARGITGDKDAHFVMTKVSIQKEDNSPHSMR